MPFGNLRALANSVTSTLNPNTPAVLFISTGNETVNYRQVPSYDKSPVLAQVQPLSTGDLRQLDALNIQGAEKAIYLNGEALALNRIQKLGGDLVVFSPENAPPEGTTWLIKVNLEQWSSTWCKVAVTLQDDDLSSQLTVKRP